MADWTDQDVKKIREFRDEDHPRGQPDNAGQFVEKDSNSSHVELPKQEYAELCSAIRTRYANAIPPLGTIALDNAVYAFRYDKWSEKIACVLKVTTDLDAQTIKDIIGEFKK